jgi:hypothetical protein
LGFPARHANSLPTEAPLVVTLESPIGNFLGSTVAPLQMFTMEPEVDAARVVAASVEPVMDLVVFCGMTTFLVVARFFVVVVFFVVAAENALPAPTIAREKASIAVMTFALDRRFETSWDGGDLVTFRRYRPHFRIA